jgi:small-conductance mechanosensitive channel
MKAIIQKISKILIVPALVLGLGLFAAPAVLAADADCTIDSGISGALNEECTNPGGNPTTLTGQGGMVTTIINIMLFIVGILCVIMIIFGGIRYATSSGDQTRVTNAKNTLVYSVVGLVVAILAYAIVNWVVGNFKSSDS